MKKATFIFLSIVLMTMSVFAQTSDNNTLKFLGIPVDGTKENMIAKLKEKGFTYDATSDVLRGEFNGIKSLVFISTYHGKVDRVMVCDVENINESNIKIRFNNLVAQMDKSPKYMSLSDNKIGDDVDISYEMTVNKKRFQASYTPVLDYSAKETQDLFDRITQLKDQDGDTVLSSLQSMYDEYITGSVWFMIVENYGKYYIAMYYDNLKNRPNGEDL